MKIIAMVLALALTTAATPADTRQQHGPAHRTHATGTWSSSMIAAAPDIFGIPNWSSGFDNQSVRQVVRVSKGGAAVRIRVSNVFGTTPLRLTGATVAQVAIVPMQDPLALGSEARMNVPGVAEGNWDWRLPGGALTGEVAAGLRDLAELFGRLPTV